MGKIEVINHPLIQHKLSILRRTDTSTKAFREAAEKMYVSQPSLSISVRDLEKELGFKIFRRTSSGTFLTLRI